MILKSFYRRRSSKIYFFVTFFIFMVIGALQLINGYLNILNDNYYIDKNLEYIQSSNDYYDLLERNKNIINLRRALFWDYDEANFFDRFIITKYELNDKVIVNPDESLNLNLEKNEIIINLSYIKFYNIKLNKDDYIGKEILFNIDGKIHTFIIKDIVNIENKNEVIISKEIFDNYLKDREYIYTFNYKNEKVSKKTKEELKSYIDKDIITIEDKATSESFSINKSIKTLKIANYIIIITFILIIFITEADIISDNRVNILLQKKIGFKRRQRIINTFVILNVTNTISIFVVAFIIPIIDIIYFAISGISIPIGNVYIIFAIYFSVLLGNLLLVIYTDN